MFKLTHTLPERYWVAVSGGLDSMSALHWLNKPSRMDSLLGVLHVNHNTGDFSNEAHEFVKSHCTLNGLELRDIKLSKLIPPGVSKEEYWRECRYEFFDNFKESIILGHNFDDCLEEYVMCTMVRGFSDTIAYSRGHCVRPFRLWKRKYIQAYADRNRLVWLNDPSNEDTKYKRNYIRHEIVPRIRMLNPGVYNIVERLVREC